MHDTVVAACKVLLKGGGDEDDMAEGGAEEVVEVEGVHALPALGQFAIYPY